jgi:hypothetical protein
MNYNFIIINPGNKKRKVIAKAIIGFIFSVLAISFHTIFRKHVNKIPIIVRDILMATIL